MNQVSKNIKKNFSGKNKSTQVKAQLGAEAWQKLSIEPFEKNKLDTPSTAGPLRRRMTFRKRYNLNQTAPCQNKTIKWLKFPS